MKHLIALLALTTFLGTGVRAQKMLTGRVLNAATKKPVAFATVYLDGTSIGDVSDDDGAFSLTVPPGMEESVLIISHLNYKAYQRRLVPGEVRIRSLLVAKAAELTSIDVEGDDRREENLKEFKDYLVGKDVWGRTAKIVNPEVVRFRRDTKRKTYKHMDAARAEMFRRRNLRDQEWSDGGSTVTFSQPINLKAATEGGLHVRLTYLGYDLHIDLVAFKNDYEKKQSAYLGSNYFVPMADAKPRDQRRYERNRVKAYYGSCMHFIRSLLADSLVENGFQVVRVIQEPSATRQQIIEAINLRDHVRRTKDGHYQLMGLGEHQYAVLYYGRRRSPRADPLLKENAAILQSRMWLAGLSTLIYPSGILGDTNLIFSGDIGNRKLAWALPSDYYPPQRERK